MARLQGKQPGKAPLLMAHYDSQPNTFGATDDASGVAAILKVDSYESGEIPCRIFPELIVPHERIFR